MYKVVELEDVVRIPPRYFSKPLKEAALEVLRNSYEGKVIEDLGRIVSILDVDISEYGYLTFNDGSLYHPARFKALIFAPILQEVIEGEVILVENIGIWVRLGAEEGFIHRSQVFASREVKYDRDQGLVFDMKSKTTIRKGDLVRARITSISYDIHKGSLKIRMTMRQPYLGKVEQIEKQIKKERGELDAEEKASV